MRTHDEQMGEVPFRGGRGHFPIVRIAQVPSAAAPQRLLL